MSRREIRIFTAASAVFFYMVALIEYHFRNTVHSASMEWKIALVVAVILSLALTRMVYVLRRKTATNMVIGSRLPRKGLRSPNGTYSFANLPASGSFRTATEAKKYSPEQLSELNKLNRR